MTLILAFVATFGIALGGYQKSYTPSIVEGKCPAVVLDSHDHGEHYGRVRCWDIGHRK